MILEVINFIVIGTSIEKKVELVVDLFLFVEMILRNCRNIQEINFVKGITDVVKIKAEIYYVIVGI